jgi:hypothetical protein
VTIGYVTNPLNPLISIVVNHPFFIILAVKPWFGVSYEYRSIVRGCLKGSRDNGSILVSKESMFLTTEKRL